MIQTVITEYRWFTNAQENQHHLCALIMDTRCPYSQQKPLTMEKKKD